MKGFWWKSLACVLLLYSLTAGLLFPLKTGVADVFPRSAFLGSRVTLTVKGYNSRYTLYRNPRAWLKMDSVHAIAAGAVRIKNARLLELDFTFPTWLPDSDAVKDLTLVVDDPADGVSILPNAVFLSRDTVAVNAAHSGDWNLTIQGVHPHIGVAFPYRNILYETIRNTFYHVPMWFAMFAMLGVSVFYGIKYLRRPDEAYDVKSRAYASTGTFFGVLGLVTGGLWAKHTWGQYFPMDVKLIMAAVAVLMYAAYFVLRSSFDDTEREARIGAIYNIFGFASLGPLLFVIPRLTSSLHPGNGGNPAFGSQDLDNTMRLVFYPACIGWILFGLWLSQLLYRIAFLKVHTLSNERQ